MLRQAIRETGLEKYTDIILKVARESIKITVTDEIEALTVGESRIGGPPDLASELQWPKYGYQNKENALSVYYFQVNLSDLPKYIGPSLPKQGLLSIFATSQNQLEDDGTVIYNSDIKTLSTQRLPDIKEFGDEDLDEICHCPVCFHKPRKLSFEKSISLPGYLYTPRGIDDEYDIDKYFEIVDQIPRLAGHELGDMFSYYYQGLPEERNPEWFSLFNLYSDGMYFSFGDCGNTAISVLRNKAQAGDFTGAEFNYCE